MPSAVASMPAQAACFHSQPLNWSQGSSNEAQKMPLCEIFDVLPPSAANRGLWLPVSQDLCPAHTHTAQCGSHHAICKVCFISNLKLVNCCHYCERAALCSRLILNDSFCNVFQINTRSRVSFIIMLVFSRMQK